MSRATDAEHAERDAYAVWQAAQRLSITDPHLLAANLGALVEAREFILSAIAVAIEHGRKAA
jgi:hypothetical protein